MSWSVEVDDIQTRDRLPTEVEEYFASQHPSYPRDAQAALDLARAVGLKSGMLSGGRTPNPYGGDEIVDISVRGTPVYKDFLSEMREIIAQGPGPDSVVARHWAALARLRAHPCSHIFTIVDMPSNSEPEQWLRQCAGCGVYLNGTLFYFEDENG